MEEHKAGRMPATRPDVIKEYLALKTKARAESLLLHYAYVRYHQEQVDQVSAREAEIERRKKAKGISYQRPLGSYRPSG